MKAKRQTVWSDYLTELNSKYAFTHLIRHRVKKWAVLLVEGDEPRIKILCNHALVLDFVLANHDNGYSECERYWNLHTLWLKFEVGELEVHRRRAPGGKFFLYFVQ